MNVAVPPSGEFDCVDHSWIGAEEHVTAIAIDVDRGDERTIGWNLRFGFDDRCERHGLMRIESGRDVRELAAEVSAEVLHHLLDDRLHGRAGTQFVCVGKKVAFERRRLRRDVVNEIGIAGLLFPLRFTAESFSDE